MVILGGVVYDAYWCVLRFTEKHLNTTQFDNYKMLIISLKQFQQRTHNFKIKVLFNRFCKINPYSNIMSIYLSLNLSRSFIARVS